MSDVEARELERRAAQGDVEAAARGLLLRLRRAAVAPERVRLAACLGDPAARLALGEDAPPLGLSVADGLDLRPALAVELERNGKEAGVRAALALAEWARRATPAPRADDGRAAAALEATRRWVACPCEEHGREAARASAAALRLAVELDLAELPRGISDEAAWEVEPGRLVVALGPQLAGSAAAAAALDERPSRLIVVELSRRHDDGRLERREVRKTPAYLAAAAAPEGLALAAQLELDLAAPLEAVRASLVPWALARAA